MSYEVKGDRVNLAILGLDTSHGPAFARIIQQAYPQHRLVAAWPGGSNAIPASRDRVQGFTREVESMAVPIVDSPEAAAANADAVFILTLDGDSHVPLLSAIMRPGLRVFIDKPMAYSATEAEQMFEKAKELNFGVFSASALRFLPLVQQLLLDSRGNPIRKINLRAPLNPIDGVPRYHFYAIHAAEILITLLGASVAKVERRESRNAEYFHIIWSEGQDAELELTTEPGSSFDLVIESNGGTRTKLRQLERSIKPLYRPLIDACIRFLEGGAPPVAPDETLAALALLDRLSKLDGL